MKKMHAVLCFIFLVVLPFSILNAQRKTKHTTKGKHTTKSSTTKKSSHTTKGSVEVWLTDPDKSVLFQQQPSLSFSVAQAGDAIITVNTANRFQTMDGFGYTLTGGSAMHIQNMGAAERKALLEELFAYDKNNIGVSYLRISIGSSDLDDHVFSYDDLSGNETDAQLDKFNLGQDRKWLIPVLKQIQTINPTIKILGSPWSAPAWMKTNNDTKGGNLRPEYYSVYANYLIKYIQAMRAEGITINAVTIQNEPLNPKNNPSMVMQPVEQASFIKTAFGPALRRAGLNTQIWLYDHNCDRPDYATTILQDADAAQYVDGSAFHLYGGTIDTLTQVHNAYPNKNLYFTEQWVGAPGHLKGDLDWHIKNVVIGSAINWSKVALEWNLAANSALQPHTPGGCTECLGAVTIDGNTVTRNPAYYIIAHAAKFVRPGSTRIASPVLAALPNAAFKTPAGKIVLLVENSSDTTKTFMVNCDGKMFSAVLNAGAVATYAW